MKRLDNNHKKILLLVIFAITFYWGIHHVETLKNLLQTILRIFTPFLLGTFVAIVLNVMIVQLESKVFVYKEGKPKYNKSRRALSTLVSTLFFIGILVLLLLILLPMVFSSFQDLASMVPNNIQSIEQWLQELEQNHPSAYNILSQVNIDFTNLQDRLINFLRDQIPNALSVTANLTSSIFTFFFNIIIGFVFSLYLVIQKEKIMDYLYRVNFALFGKKRADDVKYVLSLIYTAFSGFFTGQVIESFVFATLCFIGMKIIGIPQALTVSFIELIMAMIPMFGAIFGAILSMVIIAIVSPFKALIFLIFIVILTQFDANVIYPKIMGSSIGTPSILVLVSVTIFGSLFGILGMIGAVPITSVIYTLFNEYIERRLERKKKIEIID